jgi:hypothetical protein
MRRRFFRPGRPLTGKRLDLPADPDKAISRYRERAALSGNGFAL